MKISRGRNAGSKVYIFKGLMLQKGCINADTDSSIDCESALSSSHAHTGAGILSDVCQSDR